MTRNQNSFSLFFMLYFFLCFSFLTFRMDCVHARDITSPADGKSLTDPFGGTGGNPIDGYLNIKVVHDGTTDAFEGAFVMVGPHENNPFPNNWGFTSSTGEIEFSHPDLQGPVAITACASNHTFFTLADVNADDIVIPLKPLTQFQFIYEIGDYVSGIDVNNGSFHYGDGNVDVAFVLRALNMEFLMTFKFESLLGPMETIEILSEEVEVPTNLFIPQQWELFVEINKDHYYLYLPSGQYTLTALSGRVTVADLLDYINQGGEIVDMIPLLEWRELDILDVSVSGNYYGADLNVDPDLNETVTINLDNVPDDSGVYCFSAGDLDDLHGLGRLLSLGLNTMDCPQGSGPCAGQVTMTTTAASGEFAGMGYFPAAIVDMNATDDYMIVMDRSSHSQTYTETLSTFFEALTLSYSNGAFSWNDVQNPESSSPDVDIHKIRLNNPDGEEIYWEFLLPGDTLSMTVPCLPDEAPEGPSSGSSYTWEHTSIGMTYNLPAFDFNSFSFPDIEAHCSHLAIDMTDITLYIPTPVPTSTPTSAATATPTWTSTAQPTLPATSTPTATPSIPTQIPTATATGLIFLILCMAALIQLQRKQ